MENWIYDYLDFEFENIYKTVVEWYEEYIEDEEDEIEKNILQNKLNLLLDEKNQISEDQDKTNLFIYRFYSEESVIRANYLTRTKPKKLLNELENSF